MTDSNNPVKMILDQAFLRPSAPLAMQNRRATVDVVVRFGESEEDDPEGEGSEVETFRFLTKAEADAFVTGLEALQGWSGYKILEDGRYPR